jgi:hypothetical protein
VRFAQIRKLLHAEVLNEPIDEHTDINVAKASDLMSDVLTFSGPGKLLITGLTNNHTVKICNIAGISTVVFVRGKKPAQDTIKMAKRCNIAILTTYMSMFESCGVLYAHGMRGVQIEKT